MYDFSLKTFFWRFFLLSVSINAFIFLVKVVVYEQGEYLEAEEFFILLLELLTCINTWKKEYHEYIISSQLIRSGTSVGAIIREAEYAQSKKDFLHKLYIGVKEINECIYWLELLYVTKFITKKMHDSISNDAQQILKMLISSIKTLKNQKNSSIWNNYYLLSI